MQDSIEYARQLARFKLAVRRQLDQTVDLERLVQDPAYAQVRLAQIEEIADDEDLLVMVLTLRHKLLPARPLVVAKPVLASSSAEKTVVSRDYKFGARQW